MADTNKRSDDLGADDQRVFELLADARAQYEEYLKTQDFWGKTDFKCRPATIIVGKSL